MDRLIPSPLSFVFRLATLCLLSSVGAEEAEETPPLSARLQAGATLTEGNSQTTLLTAGADAKLAREEDEWLGSARLKYGTSTVENDDGSETKDTTVDDARASLQYNRLFGDRKYGFLKAEGQRDTVADLDHRLRAGPGLGVYLVKEEDRTLALEAGLLYVSEEKGSIQDDYVSGLLGARLSYRLSENADTWLTLDFSQSLEEGDQYFLQTETGVNTNLFGALGLQVSLRWDYENLPAETAEKSDLTFVAGVTYTL